MRKILPFLFLIVSLMCFYHSFFHIRQLFYGFDELKSYAGVLSRIDSTTRRSDTSTMKVMLLQLLDHSAEFQASRYFERIRTALKYGDSVMIYTKSSTTSFGNVVAENSNTWPVTDANEIFHLIRMNDGLVLIDFEKDRQSVKTTAITLVILGLIFTGLFLYARYGKNVEWDIGFL